VGLQHPARRPIVLQLANDISCLSVSYAPGSAGPRFRQVQTIETMKHYPTTTSHIPFGQVSTVHCICVPRYRTNLHEHDEYMFLLPRTGLLMLSMETTAAPLRIRPMSMAAVPPKRFHQTYSDCGAHEHIAVYVESDFVAFCEEKAGRQMLKDKAMVYPAPWPLLSAVRLRRQQLAENADNLAGYRLGLVNGVVATACIEAGLTGSESPQSPADLRRDLVDDIKVFLDATLAQRLDIDHVADEFGMSRRHLTRIFRELAGETMLDYVSRQRVSRAVSLLKAPGATVVAVAAAVGIESPSYLARLFHRYGKPSPRILKK
jgi:AraC-like DNA-binding protein